MGHHLQIIYQVILWFFFLKQVIASVEGEGKPIQALDVSHDGTQLVIGSTGDSVHIKTLTWPCGHVGVKREDGVVFHIIYLSFFGLLYEFL